jgi:hypothetical protein
MDFGDYHCNLTDFFFFNFFLILKVTVTMTRVVAAGDLAPDLGVTARRNVTMSGPDLRTTRDQDLVGMRDLLVGGMMDLPVGTTDHPQEGEETRKDLAIGGEMTVPPPVGKSVEDPVIGTSVDLVIGMSVDLVIGMNVYLVIGMY